MHSSSEICKGFAASRVDTPLNQAPQVLYGAEIWGVWRPALDEPYGTVVLHVPAPDGPKCIIMCPVVVLLEPPRCDLVFFEEVVALLEECVCKHISVLFLSDVLRPLALFGLVVGDELAGSSDFVQAGHTVDCEASIR